VDGRHLLAGGIGSGKSTAGSVFERLGAIVISADRVGHEVMAPGGEAFDGVANRFPGSLIDGLIDRPTLASHVFGDAAELTALEQITHPVIRSRIERIARDRDGVVLVEVPLITDFLGPGWLRIVVDAPTEVRIARLMAGGMSRSDIEARMSVQPTRGEWLEVADLVIDNRGDRPALERECRAVWARISPSAAGNRDPGDTSTTV
jgi:dephospho-CoA kinase